MIPVDADRIVGARILNTARRLTQISDTGFHQRTLIVRGALNFDACTGYRVAWNAWWTVFAAGRHLGRFVLLDAVAAIAYRSRSTVG